jgi:hypothetical protein
MSTLAVKDPAEVKGYTFDLTAWLDDLGVTISSITSVTPDSGLTVDSSGIDSTLKKVTAVYSGGTAGTNYKVVCTVVTSNNYTLVGTMTVPVQTK